MTPDRWRRLRELYERLIALDEPLRGDALAQAPLDGELRALMASMLSVGPAADAWMAGVMANAAAGLDAADLEHPVVEAAADQPAIDRYLVLRTLGEGGMSVVYAARRADGLLAGEVAIKVPRRGIASEGFDRRLQAERAILDRLNHASIAKLLDAGTCRDGRPFLVVELVDGERIDRWCSRGVPLRERVALLVRVCRAVAYAHGRLVLHRDIKPSNVFVTADGGVKLLDFGIAKLLEDDPDATSITRTSERALTPRYASPEQLSGDTMSTASDVYSLGIVLREVIVGRSPEFGRSPKGDLGTILEKATRADPSQRYQSANALADDLEAYLDSRPVSARPLSLTYELGRLVRRHPRQTVVVASAALLIVALSIVSIALAGWARASEAKASAALQESLRQQAVATRFGEFLTEEFLLLLDPARSMSGAITLEEAIVRASGRVEGRFPDAPLAEALIAHTIGDAFIQRTRYAEAEPHLRRAAALREAHLGPDATDSHVAKRDLATCLISLKRQEEAKPLLEEVLASQLRTLGEDDGLTLMTMSILGRAHSETGQFERAEELFRASYEGRVRVLGLSDGNTQSSMNQLGVFLLARQRFDEALPYLEQAEKLRRAEFGADHPRTLIARANLATLRARAGAVGDAIRDLESVRADQLRVLGPTHGHTMHVLGQLVDLYGQADQPQRMTAALRDRIGALETLRGERSAEVLEARVELVSRLNQSNRLDEAREELGAVRKVMEAIEGEGEQVPESTRQRVQGLVAALRESE